MISTEIHGNSRSQTKSLERESPQICRKLKKILFYENLRIIHGNSRSQKNKLFSVVDVVAACQRTH